LIGHSGGAEVLPPLLPLLTPNFVERKVAMKFIENSLFEEGRTLKAGSKLIVVTGIGGCGKTQLILKALERHNDWWVIKMIL